MPFAGYCVKSKYSSSSFQSVLHFLFFLLCFLHLLLQFLFCSIFSCSSFFASLSSFFILLLSHSSPFPINLFSSSALATFRTVVSHSYCFQRPPASLSSCFCSSSSLLFILVHKEIMFCFVLLQERHFLTLSNYAFTVLFAVEMTLKVGHMALKHILHNLFILFS